MARQSGGSRGSPWQLSDPPAGSQPDPAEPTAAPATGGARPSGAPRPRCVLTPTQLIRAMEQEEKQRETEDHHQRGENPFPKTVSKHPGGTGEHKGITHIMRGLWPSVCRSLGSGVRAGSFSLKKKKKVRDKPCPFRQLPTEVGCLPCYPHEDSPSPVPLCPLCPRELKDVPSTAAAPHFS